MAYTPLTPYSYGELPESPIEGVKKYKLSSSGVPYDAKEVLCYTWATTKGDEGVKFHRYYYEIWTEDGKGNKYLRYMNVAACKDVALNSANIWLPVFKDYGEIYVKLIDAEQWKDRKGKSIAYKSKCGSKAEGEEKFSEFFVMGYRK